MILSIFLSSSPFSRDISLRVIVDEKMIFTDDLACRQYFRRRCTRRQRKVKKVWIGCVTSFIPRERNAILGRRCRGKTGEEIVQFIQRKKEHVREMQLTCTLKRKREDVSKSLNIIRITKMNIQKCKISVFLNSKSKLFEM